MARIFDWRGALGGAFALALLAPAAHAQEQAGILNCRLSGSPVSILIENQAIDCMFKQDDNSVPEHYVGKLSKVGANITVNGPGELMWGVVSSSRQLEPGALSGTYVGPGVSAKLGAGGGGSMLVGGSNNTISLQPFNVQAGTGLGITAGVESLSLEYVPEEPPPPRKGRRHRHHHHHHHHHH